MGFFSWKTADSQRSIANAHTDKVRTVYLLQPNGKPPIKEPEYEGYGVFAGVDAYVWLTETNAESLGLDLAALSDEEKRHIGIQLSVGSCYQDRETGEIWHIYHDGRQLVPGRYFAGTYGALIPEFGDCANDLIASGRLVERSIAELRGLTYPLKFSFREDARYEDLPASDDCPHQGYFYD
jgi:hypothetical protein